jgi:Zn-dependent protease with chaperone function
MKYLVLLITFFYSLLSFANDTYWDLDGVVSYVQTSPSVSLLVNGVSQQVWSKDYVLNLDDVRKKISRQSGVYPKFLISSNQDVNAFATWENGQPITVFHLGLLNRIGNDTDAIAAVVSHEYSHLTLNHHQSSATVNGFIEVFAGLAMIAINQSYGGAARNPYEGLYKTGLNLTSKLASTAYSRGEELDADAQGIKYMIAAGYSPEGAIRLQENIIQAGSSFFATHPSSESRIQNIKVAAAGGGGSFNNTQQNTVIAQNVNTTQTAYTGKLNDIDFNKTCEANGFLPNTSQYDVCLFKLKRGKSSEQKTSEQKTLNAINNLPDNGQVGSIISVKKKENYVIFVSSIQDALPIGTKIKVTNDNQNISGVIDKYYDGYYSASVEDINSVKKGSRVIVTN